MSRVIVNNIKDFNLDHIFDCGQCFRWERKPDGSYTGIAFGKVVNMKLIAADEVKMEKHFKDSISSNASIVLNNVHFERSGKSLLIDNCTSDDFEAIWRDYLDLDRDYAAIKSQLSANDPVMAEAIIHGQGIRILKQDLWETIVSFIISQNNNIPRIKGCIENLAKTFGQPVGEYEGRTYYSIPGPEVLASLTETDLGPVKLGYRSKYLIETGKTICGHGLPEKEEQLASLCGVGPKVASCIKLFGMGQQDSFPVDVWVRRVMHQLYNIPESDIKAMSTYARKHFGALGGFAQQYLFYYIRENSK